MSEIKLMCEGLWQSADVWTVAVALGSDCRHQRNISASAEMIFGRSFDGAPWSATQTIMILLIAAIPGEGAARPVTTGPRTSERQETK